MKITVIGAAGCVGSCATFQIAARGLADEIVMIGGKRQNVLKQHAMDLSTAVSAQDIKVMAGDYPDMQGSDMVINCAGAAQGLIASRMEMLPKNVPIIRDITEKIARYAPGAIIITASNPPGPLNIVTSMATGFNRERIIGYSTNDSFRFREMAAAALGVKVSRVDATVMGEHGSTQVLLFSSVTVDGEKVTFTEQQKADIRAQVPNILKRFEELKSGRTAGWTCAIGLADMVDAIKNDADRMIPCSVIVDGEYGAEGISMSVPAVLGKGGVKKILSWDLTEEEKKGLQVSVDTLQAAVARVKELM